MLLGRRAVLRGLVGLIFTLLRGGRGSALAVTPAVRLTARRVASSDAAALRSIMVSCVASEESFFGKCGDWPLAWAENVVASKPDTVVLEQGGVAVAFHEVPPLPASANLPADPTAEEVALHARRETRRRIFRVNAAGVRDDLLSSAEAAAAFRSVIYTAYVRARNLGYTHAEAFAPWERHPRLEKKWTDYPGLVLVEPPARGQNGGGDVYWLRWNLDDAIAALETEGAANQLEVLP